eukprot:UN12428
MVGSGSGPASQSQVLLLYYLGFGIVVSFVCLIIVYVCYVLAKYIFPKFKESSRIKLKGSTSSTCGSTDYGAINTF